MLTRRNFLVTSAGSLGVLLLPGNVLAKRKPECFVEVAPASGIDPVIEAECSVFRGGQQVARLRMVGLEMPYAYDDNSRQFSLQFHAVVPVDLPEAIYDVQHPTLGVLELYLQPSGSFFSGQHDGTRYHACMAMLQAV